MLSLVKVTEHAKKIWLAQVHLSSCQYAGIGLCMTPTKSIGPLGRKKSSGPVQSYLGETEEVLRAR